MRTTKVEDWVFIHNPDLTGKVIVKQVQGDVLVIQEITIPGEVLSTFLEQRLAENLSLTAKAVAAFIMNGGQE